MSNDRAKEVTRIDGTGELLKRLMGDFSVKNAVAWLERDVKMLVQKNLLVISEDGRYRINTDVLFDRLPRCRRYRVAQN